jgi:hypothetical protein
MHAVFNTMCMCIYCAVKTGHCCGFCTPLFNSCVLLFTKSHYNTVFDLTHNNNRLEPILHFIPFHPNFTNDINPGCNMTYAKKSFCYLLTTISNNYTNPDNTSFLDNTSYILLQWLWTCNHCQRCETCILNISSHYKRIFMASNMVGTYYYFIILTFKRWFCSMNLSMWLYMYHSHHIHTTKKKYGHVVLDWLPTINQVTHRTTIPKGKILRPYFWN